MCAELCVRSSGAQTSRNDPHNDNNNNDTENQYVNSVALAATNDEEARARTTSDDAAKCNDDPLVLYEDLNVGGAGSAEPRVYDTIKPKVRPKPSRSGHTSNTYSNV